jgi:hypothetical protein
MVWIRVEKNRIEREKKEKNPQSQTLAKIRHPRTYLGLPMLDPTSSESGKGTRGSLAPTLGLTGLGSRLRVSQCDCSTTARLPSGERRPPTSRRATTPLLRPAASLARVEIEAGKQMTLGFCGEPATRCFLCA